MMKRNLAMFFAALAFPLALACSDSSAPTAPEQDVIEEISEVEAIITASHFSDLTDEQKAAVRAAYRAAAEQLRALRARLQAGEITREEARALARQIHEQLIQTLSTILTPEQLEAFLNRRHEHRPDPLQLTEEQKAQILALREQLAAFVHSLREQVHNGELSAEEARARLREAIHRFHAAVCAILTPEQQRKARFCQVAGV